MTRPTLQRTLAISAVRSIARSAMLTPLPRAVIFDLDGTLVDSAPDLHLLLGELLAEQGLPAPTLPAVRGMIGDGARMLIRRALAEIGQPCDEPGLDRLYDRFTTLYDAEPCRLTTIFPGAAAVLADLSDCGVRLGLCTNKPQRATELLLQALGLAPAFAAIVGGDVLPVRKPHPGHLAAVLDRLRAAPGEAVMVGDSHNDVLTAHGLGVRCVLVGFGYSAVPAEQLGAEAVIGGFSGLREALALLQGGRTLTST